MSEPTLRPLRFPVWTENKAHLIAKYLRYFVLVTKHGTYIDGFAGPQKEDKPEMWSARLVLESEPRWLRRFHLFEEDPAQVELLRTMVAGLAPRRLRELKREITIHEGDFNVEVLRALSGGGMSRKEATFCLLDQRTFECRWSTVRALAAFKSEGPKIELFYFLPNHWLGRALAAVREEGEKRVAAWWGRDDWRGLRDLKPQVRAELFAERFRSELGYASSKPWPIRERQDGGGVMYYMIHATDHPEAPALMRRAYVKTVDPPEPVEQLSLEALMKEAERAPPIDLQDISST